jgi:DsbC/DsbD-like thiol-disulfide interchange protein
MQGMWSLLAGVVMAAPLAAAQPGDEEHAKARLVSEYAALVPGQTNYLGLTFQIDPEWHLYWKGRNDTGFPIQVDLKVPEGYKVGEIQWPAPERHVSPGDILDHIYEGQVTLIIPVEVPLSAKGEATFAGSAEWLVCREACIPGDARLSLKVPLAGEKAGKPSADAKLFETARERLPKPVTDEAPLTARLDGDTYEITAKGFKHIAFYPADDCVKFENPIRDAESDKGVLRLKLADLSPGPRVKGVIEVKQNPKAKGQVYAVEYPIADIATPLRMAPPSKE